MAFKGLQDLHLSELKGLQYHDIIILSISSDNIKLSELIYITKLTKLYL